MKLRHALKIILCFFILSGCARQHIPLTITAGHPASPDALDAPMYEQSVTLDSSHDGKGNGENPKRDDHGATKRGKR